MQLTPNRRILRSFHYTVTLNDIVFKVLNLLFSQLAIILSHFMQQIHLLNATDTYGQLGYFLNMFFIKSFLQGCCSCYHGVYRARDLFFFFQGCLITCAFLIICFFYKIIGSIMIFSYIVSCIFLHLSLFHCFLMFHFPAPNDSLPFPKQPFSIYFYVLFMYFLKSIILILRENM